MTLVDYPASNALMELEGYRSLKKGWDGDSSLAPNPSHIDQAQALLRRWPTGTTLPTAMVSSDGTIGVYWDREGLYMDAEFDEAGTLSIFARHRPSNEEEFVEHLDLPNALEKLLSIERQRAW